MNFLLTLLLTGSVTVQLPPDAEVRGTSIQLGYVAEVSADDPALATAVRAHELGNVPAPGYSRVFQALTLQRELERAFPDTTFTFTGLEHCRVAAAVQRIGVDSIRDEALGALKERFKGRDAEFTLSGSLGDARVPMGREGTTLKASLKRQGTRPGVWSVPVEVSVDGLVYQTIWTTWKVELWESRRILVRSVARGDVITPDALETRRVKVDVHSADGEIPAVALNGSLAKRDIIAGSMVSLRDLERPIVIRRGDTINLEVKKGGITAKTVATAVQEGRVGDTIRIRTHSTARELAATVVSKDIALLEL